MLSLVLFLFPGNLASFHSLILFNSVFERVSCNQSVSFSIYFMLTEFISYQTDNLVVFGSSLVSLMSWSVKNLRHDVVFILSVDCQ